MGFDLSNYETVEQRLVRFWAAYPNGRVYTSMMNYTGDACVFYAELYADKEDKVPVATGYAEEVKSDRGVNATSFVENCETSAIGRAISNSRIGHTGERASVTEMEKVNRINSAPAKPDSHGSATPKQIGFLKSLARGKGWDDLQLLEYIHRLLQVDDVVVETLTAGQCSAVIDGLKK